MEGRLDPDGAAQAACAGCAEGSAELRGALGRRSPSTSANRKGNRKSNRKSNRKGNRKSNRKRCKGGRAEGGEPGRGRTPQPPLGGLRIAKPATLSAKYAASMQSLAGPTTFKRVLLSLLSIVEGCHRRGLWRCGSSRCKSRKLSPGECEGGPNPCEQLGTEWGSRWREHAKGGSRPGSRARASARGSTWPGFVGGDYVARKSGAGRWAPPSKVKIRMNP